MTCQHAISAVNACVYKSQVTDPIGRNNASVEINKVRVVCCIPLRAANAVRVMTGVARGSLLNDVPVMIAE